ncbi:MAG TPA: hypothetical protein PLS22_06715 [Aquabacterium sp.]|nr:hypothetical protein [Aquabacterium sp.]
MVTRVRSAAGRSTPKPAARRAPSTRELSAFALPPAGGPRASVDFSVALQRSPLEAIKVANLTIQSRLPIRERAVQTSELVHTASLSNSVDTRRTLIKAFRQSKQELMLVQHMTELPRDQTAAFMKDFFDEGGSTDSVAEWLQAVGAALRELEEEGKIKPAVKGARKVASKAAAKVASKSTAAGRRRQALAGGFFDDVVNWVKDTAKKVGDAVVDAVTSVVDAVIKAGKSIADAVSAAVNWTVNQVRDLVSALIKAGRRVGDILSAAVAKGVAQLHKFVEGVLAAGRQLAEVVSWAVNQAANTVKDVMVKLVALGRRVVDILKSVVGAAAAAVNAVVKGLLAAGRALAEVLSAVAHEALQVLQPVVNALLAAGKAVRDVLVEGVKLAAASLRNVVQALINAGRALGEVLAEAAKMVGAACNAVLRALVELGRTVGQLLQAVVNATEAVVTTVVKGLIALGKTVLDVALAAVSFAVATATKVFKALINAGKKVADILTALAGRAVSALRTAVEALLNMGLALSTLVADIVTSVAEGFRRGFFEGLIALGKAPLLLLKAAAQVSVSVLLLAVASIFEILGGHRGLLPHELAEAEKIFGKSIDLSRVKIATASLPADLLNWINGDRPFTTMYIINFGRNAVIDMATLIHELTHVWQGAQSGPLYMTRALEAQIGAGVQALFHKGHYDDSAAYAVTDQELIDHAGDFSKFNPEEQASIVEHYWLQKFSGKSFPSLPTVAQLEPYARQVFKGASRPPIRVLPVNVKPILVNPLLIKPVRKVAGRKTAAGKTVARPR